MLNPLNFITKLIKSSNEKELEKLGIQKELSAVVGVAYYKYTPKFWLHTWVNVLPYHYGLDEYSYVYENGKDMFEWDSGIIFGTRVTKNLGLFIEGTHMKYWDKPVYEMKFGFNYLFF